MAVLVLNPGSTTLKAATVTPEGEILHHDTIETWDLGMAAQTILSHLHPATTAIGCRVVHGGRAFAAPVRVTADTIQTIESLGELAPLHNYGAAAVLRACLAQAPQLPLIAVFDTAFHSTLPPVAHNYALPHELVEQEGLYRYGFHGIVHQETSEILTKVLQENSRPANRLITCHLGGGASICAIKDGQSIDITMGFTPLEGLMMATRSGDIDASIVLHLLHKGWEPDSIRHLLNQESGLLGVSGISTDPRTLLAASAEGNEQAKLAIDLYTYRIAKGIASMTVPLHGVDGIGFSGGIGQNSAAIREQICQQLEHLGIQLNPAANYSSEPEEPLQIHAENSAVGVWAVPSHEELVITKIVKRTLA